jgi:hypothetical protein
MEYDVLEGCSAMDRSSWMIGDRVRERALSAGVGKHAPLACYAGKCRCNSIVQMINGQLM